MCKNPASECQAQDYDLPAEEDPSGDDSEPISTDDSYMTDSTSNEDWSDSDAESASGNRVTPNMVMWHMMKEKGLISEERYKEVQEKSANDESLKNVAPVILNCCDSEDSCNDNSFSFESDDDDDDEDTDDTSSYVGSNLPNVEVNRNVQSNVGSDVVKQNGNEVLKDESNESGDAVRPKIEIATACGKVEPVEKRGEHEEKTPAESSILSGKEVFSKLSENINAPETYKDSSVNMEKNGNLLFKQTHDDDIKTGKPDTSAPGPKSSHVEAKVKEVNRSIGQETTTIELRNNNGKTVAEKDIEIVENATAIDVNSCGDNSETKSNDSANVKITESIENILKEVGKEKRILEENVMVLETYAKDLDQFYDCNRAVEKFNKTNNTLREFALFLNFYSPSAYEYIRETFNTPLPEHRILSTWYLKPDGSPGLTKKSFDILKRKSAGKRLTCALMSHAVFLTNIGLNYDQVNFGGGCNYEYTDKAAMSFVFMLVSLEENWKIPIGYFFARSVPAETHASLIRVCLTQCHQVGVDVVAITLDTPSPAEFLGCSFIDVNNLKTTFKHPECERDVAVWIDPCLALRSVQYTLKCKGLLYIDDNNKIRWSLIRKLRRLYSKDSINFVKNHSPRFLELRNHIAKVGLTMATLSESLVTALILCQELLPDRFADTAPTQRFIKAVNNLYDILNSTLTEEAGLRRAFDVDSSDLFHVLYEMKEFFIDIFENNDLSRCDKANLDRKLHTRSFVEGDPLCGFVSFLVCIESLRHLYDSLIKTKQLSRLATHRLCKDHVEDFVKNMRRTQNVEANDFTGMDFQNFYDELLDELDRNTRLSDRSIQLEYYPIENQRSPAADIKFTSGKRAFDEDYSLQYKPKKLPKTTHEIRSTKILRGYSVALDTESDQAVRKNMVGYLAGWIAAKFAKCLKCEVCVDALFSDKKLWFHKFITLKELRGVCLPSEELFRICWECEGVVRSGHKRPQLATLRNLVGRFPWTKLGKHHPMHHIHLVRAIISRYIPLRVAVPLTNKETIRMSQMFGLLKCMHMAGMMENNDD